MPIANPSPDLVVVVVVVPQPTLDPTAPASISQHHLNSYSSSVAHISLLFTYLVTCRLSQCHIPVYLYLLSHMSNYS